MAPLHQTNNKEQDQEQDQEQEKTPEEKILELEDKLERACYIEVASVIEAKDSQEAIEKAKAMAAEAA